MTEYTVVVELTEADLSLDWHDFNMRILVPARAEIASRKAHIEAWRRLGCHPVGLPFVYPED